MGHANTQMLFTVYSRFVPNLTRQDGLAFTGLVSKKTPSKPPPLTLNDIENLDAVALRELLKSQLSSAATSNDQWNPS